jgi:hypothetical protein
MMMMMMMVVVVMLMVVEVLPHTRGHTVFQITQRELHWWLPSGDTQGSARSCSAAPRK